MGLYEKGAGEGHTTFTLLAIRCTVPPFPNEYGKTEDERAAR